jgi:hypothetical protein
MAEIEFTLILKGRWDDLTPDMADAFYEAGCDDGLVGWTDGRLTVVFGREAEFVEAAVLSAIGDVRKAGYEVERIAEADAVGQADMAERLGKSRQYIHHLVNGVRGPGNFPLPISSDGPTWSWREVAAWLAAAGLASPAVAETARVLATVDAALAYRAVKRESPKLLKAVEAAVR